MIRRGEFHMIFDNIGTGCYVLAHFGLKRCPLRIRNMYHADFFGIPVQQTHHDGLA